MYILTLEDVRFIIVSLEYTKKAFRECTEYVNYEQRLSRFKEVDIIIDKMRKIRDNLKKEK